MESGFNKMEAPLGEPIFIHDIIDTDEKIVQPHNEDGIEELDKDLLSPSTSLPIGKHHFILICYFTDVVLDHASGELDDVVCVKDSLNIQSSILTNSISSIFVPSIEHSLSSTRTSVEQTSKSDSLLSSTDTDQILLNDEECSDNSKVESANCHNTKDMTTEKIVKDILVELVEQVATYESREMTVSTNDSDDIICVPGSVNYVHWIVRKGTTLWLKNQKQVFAQHNKYHCSNKYFC